MKYITKNIGSILILPENGNMTSQDVEDFYNTEMFWESLELHFYGTKWFVVDFDSDKIYHIGGWYTENIFQYIANEFTKNGKIEIFEADESISAEVLADYFCDKD